MHSTPVYKTLMGTLNEFVFEETRAQRLIVIITIKNNCGKL